MTDQHKVYSVNSSRNKRHKNDGGSGSCVKQQREQEAAKVAAKKEYDAKKGVVVEETEEKTPLSGNADRPYSKGRAYDPNRYASETTEE